MNPAINAVVRPLHESALAEAAAADQALARGQAVGPLHGVPITIKVNVDQQGVACHTALMRGENCCSLR